MNLKQKIKKILHGRMEPVSYRLYKSISICEYKFFQMKWFLSGKRRPEQKEIDAVCSNVTIIFKSFERQSMAKRLYENIQKYYPGVRVIIADDSKNPLRIDGQNLEIIQLPFNSGLSYGLNRALERVETPYVMRMDDDELLTPYSKVGDQLEFLQKHPEVDLVAFGVLSSIKCIPVKKNLQEYYKQTLSYAPKPLKIPHLTEIDKDHIVVAKPPQVFLARTDRLREVGYDDNIRMIDHDEFFRRASGNIVSVIDKSTIIFHDHNQFDANYEKYRRDVLGDKLYIRKKYGIK